MQIGTGEKKTAYGVDSRSRESSTNGRTGEETLGSASWENSNQGKTRRAKETRVGTGGANTKARGGHGINGYA